MKAIERVEELGFDEAGLIPAIAQDRSSGKVVQLGFMNRETLAETLETGRMTYWSRSRQERWLKGETSGDFQEVREVFYNCDANSLLFMIDQRGKGACHTGEFSCFFRDLRDLAE